MPSLGHKGGPLKFRPRQNAAFPDRELRRIAAAGFHDFATPSLCEAWKHSPMLREKLSRLSPATLRRKAALSCSACRPVATSCRGYTSH